MELEFQDDQSVAGNPLKRVGPTNPLPVTDAAVLAAITALQVSLGALVVDADGATLLAADSSKVYSNEGATAIDPFVLPAAAAGLNFTFIVQDADGIRVTAAAGDTIRIASAVSAAAGKIESTAIGSVVRLYAINATEWIAVYAVGTWTVT